MDRTVCTHGHGDGVFWAVHDTRLCVQSVQSDSVSTYSILHC